MARPRRERRPLHRPSGKRPELRTVVVYCEGKVSEPEYLRAFKRLPEIRRRTSVRIEIATAAAVPYPLVEAAVRLAGEHGVRLAVSNPSFELWLVLHHRDWTRPDTSTSEIARAAQALPEVDGKHIDADALMALRRSARDRAHRLAERHASDGTTPLRGNPSTGVYTFLDAHDEV